MTEDNFFSDVSTESVDQANTLLKWLSEQSHQDWKRVLENALSASEYTTITEKLGEDFNPLGAVMGGTGIAKEHAGLSGEDSQRAVRLLKRTGRLIQAGKGRGRALIVVQTSPMKLDDFEMPARTPRADPTPVPVAVNAVDLDSVPALLKRARDGFLTVSRELEGLKNKVATIGDLEAENTQLRNEVVQLQAELERALSHTWS